MENKSKKVALHNLGCKVNSYETDAMAKLLAEDGYEIVDFAPGADVYIINTCTVTNIADRKSRQMLHKAKKMNPEAIVVAVGCYVQAAGEELKKDEAIDIIVGNNRKQNIVEILRTYELTGDADTIIDMKKGCDYENAFSYNESNDHVRAYIKIQDGCNQFCSYCIIPYARGRVRSRDLEDMVNEVRIHGEKGYKEVVLTGIHLSSYGVDLKEKNLTLLDAIKACAKIEGIERIRLGSLEQGIITEAFLEALRGEEKFCPHFHLSLQSGCDETLARMNRRYTAKEYLEKCEMIRKVFPDAAITTDVIVGFVGETEEEFACTKEFLQKVNFAEMHIFKYSRRNGTKAATMPNQVPDQIKTERSNVLIALEKKLHHEFLQRFVDKEIQVLVEEEVQLEGVTYLLGHTKEYVKVVFESSEKKVNEMVMVRGKSILQPSGTEEEILLAEI